MKRWPLFALIVLSALISGCAAPTVRSDVTVFQEWSPDLQGASFVFERSKSQETDPEYRSYENMVRSELQHLGFMEAADAQAAKLKVATSYSNEGRDVRVVEPVVVDPFWYERQFYHSRWRGYRGPYIGAYYGPYFGPYYGPHFGPGYGPFYGSFYSPFYDPFWFGPPLVVEYRESNFEVFKRQLKIAISPVEAPTRLYDVSVVSEGRDGSLANVMPYMVRSAFMGFPAKNGEVRKVVLPILPAKN